MTEIEVSEQERLFDVIFTCDATNDRGMRTDMIARMIQPDSLEFSLSSDEGAFHGGGGTAPTPLMLFAGGLSSCLMTQLRAFSKRMKIDAGRIELKARLHWEGRQTGRAPYVTRPVSFEIDIGMDGSASEEDRRRLIAAAKLGCFVEQTLAQANTVTHRLRSGERWIDV